jgi:glutamyl-tRNA synthetase
LRQRAADAIAASLQANDTNMASVDLHYLSQVTELMKERVNTYLEIPTEGYYFFEHPKVYDPQVLAGKWTDKSAAILIALRTYLHSIGAWNKSQLDSSIKEHIKVSGWGIGQVFPLLRLALAGSLQGPDLFAMMELLGQEETIHRIELLLNSMNEAS